VNLTALPVYIAVPLEDADLLEQRLAETAVQQQAP